MLAREGVNGYSAAEIEAAMLGASGVIERRWRFELYDRNGNFLRHLYSVREAGGIKYDEKNPSIRRGGSIQIDEKKFTLVDEYFNYNGEDNLDLELPNLYRQILNESPLVYLRLGDASGTTAQDATPSNRDGTYSGDFTLNQGSLIKTAQENGAVLMGGTTSTITIADAAAFDANNISVEFWAKTTSIAAAERIIERDVDDSNHCWVVFHVAGELRFRIYIGAVAINLATGVFINDGIPHHIVCSYDGAFMRAYIDGVEVARQAQTGNIDAVTSGINIGSFRGSGFHFTGTLDEFAFYGYALSAAQVAARYQAGSGQLYEVDFLHHLVKAICGIKMSTVGDDGTYWAEFPRGLFKFIYPDRHVDATGAYYDGLIHDLTARLEETTVRAANYVIPITKKYREALVDLFTGVGFTSSQYSIATSTIAETTLPVEKEYGIGTTYLFIMNELLREMNYRQASARSDGLILLDVWVSAGSRQPELTLTANSNSIINASLKQGANLKDSFNEIFLKKPSDKGVQGYVSTKVNTNVSHPTSYPRLGYYKTFANTSAVAASQTELDAQAERLLEEKARISYKIELQTPLLCISDNDDFIKIIGIPPPPIFSAAFQDPPEDFIVSEWGEPFSDVGDSSLTCEFFINVN